MADPLSIAASIAGIVTLVDVVFCRLVKYSKSASNAAGEAKAWAAEINSLGGTLSSLARLARALEDESFDETLRMHHIDGCSRVLSELNNILKKAEKDLESQNRLTALQRKVKWPLSADRIKELMSELSRHKASIKMALSADSMNGILRCLALGSSIQASTSEILTEIKDTKRITARIEQDGERRRVLDFFLQVNPQEEVPDEFEPAAPPDRAVAHSFACLQSMGQHAWIKTLAHWNTWGGQNSTCRVRH
jgi:hypothetical protein